MNLFISLISCIKVLRNLCNRHHLTDVPNRDLTRMSKPYHLTTIYTFLETANQIFHHRIGKKSGVEIEHERCDKMVTKSSSLTLVPRNNLFTDCFLCLEIPLWIQSMGNKNKNQDVTLTRFLGSFSDGLSREDAEIHKTVCIANSIWMRRFVSYTMKLSSIGHLFLSLT